MELLSASDGRSDAQDERGKAGARVAWNDRGSPRLAMVVRLPRMELVEECPQVGE